MAYLYTEKYGTIRRYQISRETEASYFLWMNNRYEQKVPKKSLKTGSGWDAAYYMQETPELSAQYERQQKIYKYRHRCEKLSRLQNPTDEIMDAVLAINLPNEEEKIR